MSAFYLQTPALPPQSAYEIGMLTAPIVKERFLIFCKKKSQFSFQVKISVFQNVIRMYFQMRWKINQVMTPGT